MEVKGKVARRWEDVAAKKKSGTSLNLVPGVSQHLRGKRLPYLFINAANFDDRHALLSNLHVFVDLQYFVRSAYLTVFVLLYNVEFFFDTIFAQKWLISQINGK